MHFSIVLERLIFRYVTITDREVAIYNTPDGVLYNMSVLQLNYEEEFGVKNVKRENKVRFSCSSCFFESIFPLINEYLHMF